MRRWQKLLLMFGNQRRKGQVHLAMQLLHFLVPQTNFKNEQQQ